MILKLKWFQRKDMTQVLHFIDVTNAHQGLHRCMCFIENKSNLLLWLLNRALFILNVKKKWDYRCHQSSCCKFCMLLLLEWVWSATQIQYGGGRPPDIRDCRLQDGHYDVYQCPHQLYTTDHRADTHQKWIHWWGCIIVYL